MATATNFKYKKNTHRKITRQGAGQGTKHGRGKGSLKQYRGQGGKKSVKR